MPTYIYRRAKKFPPAGIVIHIPHASTVIPEPFLNGILLPREALINEAYRSADIYCDELYAPETAQGRAPERVIAKYSRLACDVERFRDDTLEAGAKKGNGLFYTHTYFGVEIRKPNAALREKALTDIYDPHHAALTAAVDRTIAGHGRCLIIDGHSFGDEPGLGDKLPDFCIGADAEHTPGRLVTEARAFLEGKGFSVAVNFPFSGAIAPMKYYGRNKNVSSIMIEVNKRLYLKDALGRAKEGGPPEKSEGFAEIRRVCGELTNRAAAAL